jgi:hypothetical protein
MQIYAKDIGLGESTRLAYSCYIRKWICGKCDPANRAGSAFLMQNHPVPHSPEQGSWNNILYDLSRPAFCRLGRSHPKKHPG